MDLKLGKLDLEGMMRREIEARHRTMRVAAHLVQNNPKFSEAKLAICGYELDGPRTTRLAGPAPDWAMEFKKLSLSFADKNQTQIRLPITTFAGPVKGLWCLNEAARLEDAQKYLLRDPVDVGDWGLTTLTQSRCWASEILEGNLDRLHQEKRPENWL